MKPLVSIITPVYNSAEFITSVYDSIRCQTIKNWEWLVIDDASTDNSYAMLKSFAKNDERIKIIKNSVNSGAGASRNNGLNIARGKYIAFLDADDVWMQEKLEKQLKVMNDGADISFTPFCKRYLRNNSKKLLDLKAPKYLKYEQLLAKKATFGCSTVIIRAAILNGLRMSENRTGQDYLFWLNILRTGTSAVKLDDVLTVITVHPNSISYNKIKKALVQWKVYRNELKFTKLQSLFYFVSYAYHALVRP